MHILIRERHGLEEGAVAEDLGQAPADLVVLSFSDSDLSAFAAAWQAGRKALPSLRLANIARLRHPLSVDLYVEKTLVGARAILIRLLGGADYWRYGLDEVFALAKKNGIALAVVPGDGRPDAALDAYSTVSADLLARLKELTDTGGAPAAMAALAELAQAAGLAVAQPATAAALPRFGFYAPGHHDTHQPSPLQGGIPQPRFAAPQSGGEGWVGANAEPDHSATAANPHPGSADDLTDRSNQISAGPPHKGGGGAI